MTEILSGASMTRDGVPTMKKALKVLAGVEILVGIPSDGIEREDVETGKTITVKGRQGRKNIVITQTKKSEVNNAELGYIHEHGDPAANLPARPFLVPGIREGQKDFGKYLKQAAEYAIAGDADGVVRAQNAVGLTAQAAVRLKINTGPFAPLSPKTIRGRQTRSGSRNNMSTQPLIDTGQLRSAINYVIRKFKRKSNANS